MSRIISWFLSSEFFLMLMNTVSTILSRSFSATMPDARAFSLFTGRAMRLAGM
jgi:hypothetical protein